MDNPRVEDPHTKFSGAPRSNPKKRPPPSPPLCPRPQNRRNRAARRRRHVGRRAPVAVAGLDVRAAGQEQPRHPGVAQLDGQLQRAVPWALLFLCVLLFSVLIFRGEGVSCASLVLQKKRGEGCSLGSPLSAAPCASSC